MFRVYLPLVLAWLCDSFLHLLFFGAVRDMCFLPHNIAAYMFVAAIAQLLFFWGWYVFDFMIFFAARHCFFDFRHFLARLPFVCVVFPVLVANKHFFLICLPPMSQVCSDVFSCFSTFHVKHCCFLYEILPLLCSFFTVSVAIFCGFCCLLFLVFVCCHTVLCGLHADCLLLAFVGGRCRGIIFLLFQIGIIRAGFGAADFRLNRVSRLANTGWY